MFHPDYDKYPRFRNARCTRDNVTAGSALFYPREYWHATLNHGDEGTIYITDTLVDGENFREMTRRMRGSCANRGFRHSARMCDELETRCFPLWEQMFAGDDTTGPAWVTAPAPAPVQ